MRDGGNSGFGVVANNAAITDTGGSGSTSHMRIYLCKVLTDYSVVKRPGSWLAWLLGVPERLKERICGVSEARPLPIPLYAQMRNVDQAFRLSPWLVPAAEIFHGEAPERAWSEAMASESITCLDCFERDVLCVHGQSQ